MKVPDRNLPFEDCFVHHTPYQIKPYQIKPYQIKPYQIKPYQIKPYQIQLFNILLSTCKQLNTINPLSSTNQSKKTKMLLLWYLQGRFRPFKDQKSS